jgi:hypothetical protein
MSVVCHVVYKIDTLALYQNIIPPHLPDIKFTYNIVTYTHIYLQSTTVYVPSSELGLSHPLSRQRVCPSPRNQMGGGGECTRLRVRGRGTPNSDDWRKSLALCLLCAYT